METCVVRHVETKCVFTFQTKNLLEQKNLETALLCLSFHLKNEKINSDLIWWGRNTFSHQKHQLGLRNKKNVFTNTKKIGANYKKLHLSLNQKMKISDDSSINFIGNLHSPKKTFSFNRFLYVGNDWSTGFRWFSFLERVRWLLRVLFLQHFRFFARLGVVSTPASLVNLECSLHITKHFFSSDNKKILAELILEYWIELVHVLFYVAEGIEFLLHISSTSANNKFGYLPLGRKHISS